jgi:hypothetical protein
MDASKSDDGPLKMEKPDGKSMGGDESDDGPSDADELNR